MTGGSESVEITTNAQYTALCCAVIHHPLSIRLHKINLRERERERERERGRKRGISLSS
jgi:hypothetical protein